MPEYTVQTKKEDELMDEFEENMNEFVKKASRKMGEAQVVAAKVVSIGERRWVEMVGSILEINLISQPNIKMDLKSASEIRAKHELMVRDFVREHKVEMIRAGFIEARGDGPVIRPGRVANTMILGFQIGDWDFRPVMVQAEHEE